jgi:hypothetical protein
MSTQTEQISAIDEALPPDLLQSAAALLRVGVSAYDHDGDILGDAGVDDILEIIQTAKARIDDWLSQIGRDDGTGAFDALDILTLAQAAIVSGLRLSTKTTISPIRGAMKMAVEALTRAVEDNQPGPAEAEREAA